MDRIPSFANRIPSFVGRVRAVATHPLQKILVCGAAGRRPAYTTARQRVHRVNRAQRSCNARPLARHVHGFAQSHVLRMEHPALSVHVLARGDLQA